MAQAVVFDCDGTLLQVNGVHSPLVFEGVLQLLEVLQVHNIPMYIWTGRDRSSLMRHFEKLGLLHFFDDFYCAEDGPSKPSPFGLNKLLGPGPHEDVWVIGDSSVDMCGGREARLKTCLLYTSPSPRDRQKSRMPSSA